MRVLHYSDLENIYDNPDAVSRFVKLINTHRDKETLVVGSGDVIGPSVLSLVTNGDVVVDIFEAIKTDAETFGNHDFDLGLETLTNIITNTPQTWLATNIDHKSGVLSEAGAVPYTVVNCGSCEVGLLGVTTPELSDMNHRASQISVQDPISAVETYTKRLRRSRNVDAVIVLSHLGNEREFATQLDISVDAVLGGHNHDQLATEVDGTIVARPGVNGTHVTDIRLKHPRSITHHPVARANRNEAISKRINAYISSSGLSDTVATVPEPITLDKKAGSRGESRIGNFVTDAFRWKTGADVAVIAARMIRTGETLEGEVTPFDLIKIAPFDDQLVVLDLPGCQLIDLFRELRHETVPTLRDWYFGHVSGATLVWNQADELDRILVDGATLDATATYEVATSSYFVQTNHIFTTLKKPDVIDSFGPQYDALVEYAETNGIEPEIEGRIIRSDYSQN